VKVLWIDFIDRFYCLQYPIKKLTQEGFEVSTFEWFNPEIGDLDINGAINAAKEVDLVIVHFGSIPRGQAAEILARIKATKVKIIVNSVSSVLFEAADEVIGTPLNFGEELVECVNRVIPKNRS